MDYGLCSVALEGWTTLNDWLSCCLLMFLEWILFHCILVSLTWGMIQV